MNEQLFKELKGSIGKCHLHHILFGAEGLPPHFGIACPMCERVDKAALREALEVAVKQRDALLAAIEIKRTADVVKSWAIPGSD